MARHSGHDDFAEHARVHVVQQVAMPGPAAEGIGADEEAHALRRLHADGVLAHLETAARILQLAPHAVHVHGVIHHGVVVEDDAEPFAVAEVNRC